MFNFVKLMEDAQHEYETTLSSIFLHWQRGWFTQEEADRARVYNRRWFHLIYSHLRPHVEVPYAELTDDLITKYNTMPDAPLISVVFYHDTEIPIYADDNGQQMFTIWEGHHWSGGTYNVLYARDFCEEVDEMLDERRWQEMEAEYNRENNI